MRLILTAVTFVFGLWAAPVLAATTASEVPSQIFGKRYFCSGELVVMYVLHIQVDLTNFSDVASMNSDEDFDCKLFNGRDLSYVGGFALKRGQEFRFVFQEFSDNIGTTWYRWWREDFSNHNQ